MIAKRGVPWKCPRYALLAETRAKRDIRGSVKDWSQEKRQFSRSIAVVTVEEHHNVRAASFSQPGQAGATVAATGLVEDAGSHL